MTPDTITNSQCLRVIGQQLTALDIYSFELKKSGEEYIVRMHSNESCGKQRDNIFLNSDSQYIHPSPDQKPQSIDLIRLSQYQILQADSENRLRRYQPTAMPDPYKLSTLLRVLGDYLDRKGAEEFAIRYDSPSLTVKYGQKSENLRIDNLYDLGVHMYLRRSTRGRAS